MHLLSPLNLLWLLPLGGLIVLMYILKLRRKDVVVSSTFLWQQVIRDAQANAPFQKLHRSLLLLLQLLIAALLVFALASPFWRVVSFGGRTIVLIVDSSASMRATDVAPSRLEAAKTKARERIGDLHPGDTMLLLAAGPRPEALTGFTAEKTELLRALDTIAPRDTPNSLRDSLTLAADLIAARKEIGRIELISDGVGAAQENGNNAPFAGISLGKTHVAYYPIGAGHDNVGITAVDYRRGLGSEKTVQLLVVTHNYAVQPKTFTEEIYAGDNLVDAHEITLPPSGEETEPFDLPEPDEPLKMRVRLDLKDDLAADNEAALIVRPRNALNVLLVGRENLFLESALKVDPAVQLSKTAAFTTGKGFDVVVFTEAAPAKLPEGNYLFLHCVSDQAPVRVRGSASQVAVSDWERDDPILRYVDFGEARFPSALKATPLDWGRELASGDAGSLVVAGEKGRTRAEFVAFSLADSDFPLRVAFPIFIANSLRWLARGDEEKAPSQIATGSPITIPAPSAVGKLTVTKPDGTRQEIPVGERGGALFEETDEAGFYTASAPGFAMTIAANLASAAESDITPRTTLPLPDNPPDSAGRLIVESRALLPWLALLALIALGIEWWAYHRRAFMS